MKEDPFKDLPLHDTWFDWDDKSLTPDSIGRRLMGRVSYWNNPEFGKIEKNGELIRGSMEPHEIEREILFEAGRDNWGNTSPYNKPYYQHMLTLMGLLDDDTDITPTIADATRAFCLSLTHGMKVLNLIGSQNSGKSAGSVRIAFACLYIDPEFCQVFVANPFDNIADSTIWGEVLEMWSNICKSHPMEGDDTKTYLFPQGYVYANKTIIAIPNEPKGARIELRNVKKAGKFKGSKTRGKETHRGIILVLVDEINEIESHAFLSVLPNLSSQDGFFCVTSQNFKEEDDMGGLICEPVPRYNHSKEGYSDLDVDEDQFWASAYSSTTLRFDGARSANLLSARTIYGYLFKQEDWNRLLELGEESPDFFSQARSFPVRGSETASVLPQTAISKSRCDDKFYTRIGQWVRVAFCDPAFGGRDKAKWGLASFGLALVPDGSGDPEQIMLFEVEEHFSTLRITKDAVYNEFWFARMRAVGISTADFVENSLVSPDDQVAIQCAELNKQYGIIPDHFGYDFSLRAHIVTSMIQMVGKSCHAFEYSRGPEGVHMDRVDANTKDEFTNRSTELAFLTADLFHSQIFRGAEKCQNAIMQLSRTKFRKVNRKREAENKRIYKSRWKGQSPDDRDVLMGLRGMADRCGFSGNTSSAKSSTVTNPSSRKEINNKFRIRKPRKVRASKT
tara:strand:+ start:8593 stop:10620 length:2028 start_codon:yes stop_codon:yes gene_type:complete